jgi:hypothetical protein
MAAPNIVYVATITGKSKRLALTDSVLDILENPAASGKVFKVNSLYVANVDGTSAADVTVSFVDASPSLTTKLANTIPVPADASIVIISKDAAIYLEEGDKITGLGSASGDLEATVSYEEIS